MRFVMVVAGAALALAACGSEKSGTFETEGGEGSYSVDADSGETTATMTTGEGTAKFQSGANVKAKLPEGWTIYPGAEVSNVMNIDGVEGNGSMVTMEVEATADELAGFYRKQAEKAGIEIEMKLTINEGRMIGGTSKDGEQFSLNVTPSESDGAVTAQLMVSRDLVN